MQFIVMYCNVRMYPCMYVRMYCMYVCMYVMYECTYVCMCMYVYMLEWTCTRSCPIVFVHPYSCPILLCSLMYVSMYVCVCMYVCNVRVYVVV